MIFNSITRQLNQQDRRYHQVPSNQQSYFPETRLPASDIFRSGEDKAFPKQKTESALSKMNSKISENIEYLRYKDQIRRNELYSSRVSLSSNRSNRSNRTSKSHKNSATSSAYLQGKSNTSSQLRTYLPPEQSKVKTFVPLNQQPDSQIHSSYNYWKNSSIKNETAKELASNQFKYFTRNPVTIDTKAYAYRQDQRREPQRDASRELQRSIRSHQSESFEDFQPYQEQQLRTNTLQPQATKQPPYREWNTSFGGSLRNSNINHNHNKQNVATFEDKKQQKVTQKPEPEIVSPLTQKKAGPKSSIIISAGLIALGVLILLLQILK